MKRLSMLLLLTCAGIVFGASFDTPLCGTSSVVTTMADTQDDSLSSSSSAAASSSSAAASSSSTVSHTEEANPVLMPMHKVSLYELCQYAIIKAHKVREAEDVEQREELGVLAPLWKRDIKKTVTSLNALLKHGIVITSYYNKDARQKWTKYTKLLIKKGANPDIRFSHDRTARGTLEVTPFLWCLGVLIANIDFAKEFLSAGADIRAMDGNGSNALHYTCSYGISAWNYEWFQQLITARVDVNQQNVVDGCTPLHRFAHHIMRCIRGDRCPDLLLMLIVMREFLDAGAQVDIKDKEGKTVSDLLHEAKDAIAQTVQFRKFGRTLDEEREVANALDQAISILKPVGQAGASSSVPDDTGGSCVLQ